MYQRVLYCAQQDWQEVVFQSVAGAPGLESGYTLRIDEQFERSKTSVQHQLSQVLV